MTNTRAALFIATQARLDGKTRNRVACKPPNKKCGNRCIPPDWDCRLNGEGGDGHLRAAGRGSDPLAALANTQRGLTRLRKGILTGNFSELEGGRKAVIRGAVKASPQDLKKKKELQAALVQGSIGIGIALAVLGGGIRTHGILSNVRAYREGIGKKIDDSVSNAMHNILDLHPARGRAKSEARAAVAELVGRRRGVNPIDRGNSGLPATSEILRQSTAEFSPFSDLGKRVRGVDPKDYTDFGAWHRDSYKAMWSTPRLKDDQIYNVREGYHFATLSGEDFLRSQYKITGGVEVSGSALVRQMADKLDIEHKTVTNFAKDRGYNLTKVEDRIAFTDFMLEGQQFSTTARDKSRSELLGLVSPRFNASTAAKNTYSRTVNSYDKFYESITNSLPKVYDENGLRRAIPVDQFQVMQNAMQGHAEFFATRLYPNAGRRAIKGPYSADLANNHYFQTGGSASTVKAPWSAPRLTIQKAAEEHVGRPVKDLDEAVTILKGTGAFEGLVGASTAPTQRARPAVAPRNMKRAPFKFETPEEEVSFSAIVAGLVDRKRPDGKPLYKTRAAAEAAARVEIQKRRMGGKNKRSDAYYEAFNAVRADKRCGKSGIPDNKKCSKTTSAAQAAMGGQQPTSNGTLKTAATVAGAAAAVAITAGSVLAYRNRATLVPELSTELINKLSSKEIKQGISKLPTQFQEPVSKLVGKAKLGAVQMSLKVQGAQIKAVDINNNFSTWERPGYGFVSVGSVGDSLLVFGSEAKGRVGAFPHYSMGFTVDTKYDKAGGMGGKQARQIITTTKSMYKAQVDMLPENTVLHATPHADDGLGGKRKSIYEKFGFKTVPGVRGKKIWALKNQGKFTEIPDNQMEYMAKMIRGDAEDSSDADKESLWLQPKSQQVTA